MKAVTVSSKFQIVIPKAVREQMKLKVGQRFHLVVRGDQLVLVPEEPIENLRGFAKGKLDSHIERDEDRV